MFSENTIRVYVKNNYGQDVVYPVCDKAFLFAEIANTKTLTPDTIKKIKALGYKFTVLAKEI